MLGSVLASARFWLLRDFLPPDADRVEAVPNGLRRPLSENGFGLEIVSFRYRCERKMHTVHIPDPTKQGSAYGYLMRSRFVPNVDGMFSAGCARNAPTAGPVRRPRDEASPMTLNAFAWLLSSQTEGKEGEDVHSK